MFHWCGCLLAVVALMLASCSTTKNLPEDEYLYTGIKKISIDSLSNASSEGTALEELNAALAYAPNNSFFGSSTLRVPLPIGLWIYNSMEDKEYKGIKKWWYNTFAATPKTITSANPDTRVKVASNLLQNYGYFQNTVDYELIEGKNPRTRKISYNVHLGKAALWDSIVYNFPTIQDSIIRSTAAESYLKMGNQFSVVDLQNERTRLNTAFHNNGYYYYRPDYVLYFADSINNPGKVKLLVVPDLTIPQKAKTQWKIGRMSVFVRKNGTNGINVAYDDTIEYKRLTYGYQGKTIPLKPRVMFRGFKFWTGRQYNEDNVSLSLASISSMGIFTSPQFTFTPHDTTDTCSVLDVRLDAALAKPIDAEVAFNFSQRSNSQIGPDAALTLSRMNFFHYGETFSLKLKGAYYWQYKNREKGADANNMDSYNWGVDASMAFPWVQFPGAQKKFRRYPSSTKYSIGFSRENIAKYYRFNTLKLGIDYQFQTGKYYTHTFSPLTVNLVETRNFTPPEDTDLSSIYLATIVQDEFTPSISYKFSFDNSSRKDLSVITHLDASIKEAGNLISGIQAIAGKSFNERGKDFGLKNYSQFVKLDLELRNKFKLTTKSQIATRLLFGGVFAYGNSVSGPLTEWYYSGGPSSIRAFASRSIGPGAAHVDGKDFYLYHSGDMKLEANAEYRFPIFANLFGAVFVDAGNVWELDFSKDENLELSDSKFSFKTFANQIALGTGFGFRYDMEFLVLRLDFGIALHAPYETSRSGYYNIPHFFKDGFQFHFAVGYPF